MAFDTIEVAMGQGCSWGLPSMVKEVVCLGSRGLDVPQVPDPCGKETAAAMDWSTTPHVSPDAGIALGSLADVFHREFFHL